MIEGAFSLTRAELVGIPVNPNSGDSELAHILSDSGAALVITDEARFARLRRLPGLRDDLRFVVVPETGRNLTESDRAARPGHVHDYTELLATEPALPAPDGLGLDQVAWMLYTSGTTGAPKGVLSTQYAALWSAVHGYVSVLGIGRGDRLLWPLPLHHSFAFNLGVLGVLAAGATARVLDDFSPAEIVAELREEPCTLMAAVPTMCHYLVDRAENEGLELDGLRAFLVAGSLTSAALGERFQSAFGIPLIDSYGSTETTGVITCNPPDGDRVHGSCGTPVPGIDVRVTDPETGAVLPTGAEGEIQVNSPSLMLGYHNAPEQTRAAFDGVWYRTGDMGRLDARGYLRITGRLRELIIRGGENMHPAEIEDVIRESAEVADVAVVARPHTTLGEVPTAYLVARPGQALPVGAITAALRARLAWFKVPVRLHRTDSVPRTASGKTIRHQVAERPSRLLACTATHHSRLLDPDGAPLPASVPDDDTSPVRGARVELVHDEASATGARGLADHLRGTHGAEVTVAPLPDGAPDPTHPEAVLVLLSADGAHDATVSGLAAAGRFAVALTAVPEETGPDALAEALDAALLERSVTVRLATADVAAPATTGAGPDPERARQLAAEYRELRPGDTRRHLLETVVAEMAKLLGLADSRTVDPRKAFRSLGFDSRTAVELRNRLISVTGLVLPASLAFDHPTPWAVATHLGRELLGDDAPEEAEGPEHPENASPVGSGGVGDDPVVIVGMACRYPGGVRSAEDLWRLVVSGGDAVGPFPEDRGWDLDSLLGGGPDVRGTSSARGGGFLEGVGEFDAEFFGISPREALAMDPQQRLLLETSWELFEHAGIDPESLRGSRTGVFAGQMYHDYALRLAEEPGVEGYLSTGLAGSVLSGRLAYFYGFEGPALTVDTACSSSLVALRLAVESLRRGECDVAVAGGVTVMSTPGSFVDFSRQGGLSGDGRCRAFGGGADGTGWGEGVGLVLVERLSVARRLGHEVWGVVRGCAVNQDGASNGLSAPNGVAQRRVIRGALVDGGVGVGGVDVVEGHGTGTVLGDPIEAEALLGVYGRGREAGRPLWLGSVKSNLGHTQAAAGVAGVIKMVMAMRWGVLPRTLFVEEPSSLVDWSSGGVRLLGEEREWPVVEGRPRRAGVSSFGISGTNAHIILEEPPTPPPAEPRTAASTPDGAPLPILISARDADGLRAQAASLHAFLADRPELPLPDVAWSLALTRSPLEHRAALTAAHHAELLRGLAGLADAGTVAGDVPGSEGGQLAFLFSGQGSQRLGMGRELYGAFPVFAAVFDEVCGELDGHLGGSVRGVVFGDDAVLLGRTVWAQAGLFAVEVALFRLLESWGVRPDYLLGHSIGEVAAACVAGVFSLPDAARLVAARGRLMDALPGGGVMVAVGASCEVVVGLLSGYEGRVGVAAVNGPASVVVSGEGEAVAEVVGEARALGHRVKRLEVSHAFHSPLMEPMLDEFAAALREVELSEPRIPVVSNVTGRVAVPGELSDVGYWVRQVRESVLFAEGVRTLAGQGVARYLEVGPDAVLSPMARECLPATGREGALAPGVTALCRRGRSESSTVTAALGTLFTWGVPVDWAAYFAGSGARRTGLPTYPFARRRYWPDTPMRRAADGTDDPDGLLYRATWEQVPLAAPLAFPGATSAALGGDWVVVSDGRDEAADGLPAEVTAALEQAGARVLRLPLTEGDDRQRLALRLAAVLDDTDAPPAGILSLPHGELAPYQTLSLIQALSDTRTDAPLWLGTRAAVTVPAADGPGATVNPTQAQLWGLGRVAALELPGGWGGVVDLPGQLDAETGRRLAVLLSGAVGEDEVALRPDGAVHARRLERMEPVQAHEEWAPAGTVLITGGTGALGAHLARRLATAGAAHLLLTSRRGAEAPGAAELAAELEELGARVTLATCDVADEQALAAVLDGIPAELPLKAVVHAAGVLDDGVITSLTAERLAGVLAAKTDGALHLDRLTRGHDLDAFVLFSSLAGVVGAAGQANYAMANAALDALAERRRLQGLPATAVAWGAWQGDGMAAADGTVRDRVRRTGFRPMRPATALRALEVALRQEPAALLVVDVDWDRYAEAHGPAAERPLLRRVITPSTPAGGALLARLDGRTADERRAELLDVVRSHAAELLMHPSGDAIDPDRSFRALGFDSLAAVELRNRLAALTALTLPASLVFDHPSPRALADFLHDTLSGVPEESASVVEPVVGSGGVGDDPVVIVGMACRYPGGVRSAEDLWRLVVSGGDAVGPFPEDRGWDLDSLLGGGPDVRGTSSARGGGFLEGVGEFDAEFFGISPREALAMDPQQRLLLETSWELFEHAGIDPESLRGSRTGVFAGQMYHDYALRLAEEPGVEGYLSTGLAGSVLSGRLAYFYGFEGPALTVDTACSSSLVALRLAVESLRRGECDVAVAGGVTVMSTPGSFVDFSRQGGLSGDGRCRAFGGGADGTGWGEGVGLVLVERLSVARRLGHEVWGVVRGCAVNQDGASNGLSAPNGVAQRRVIRGALVDGGVGVGGVDVVEGHGTGTVLGDPIEAEALLGVYGRGREVGRPLWLGSVKSNLGHTQAAAGVAGVIKMVMAMRWGVLPRTLFVEEPSSLVDWSSGGVRLLGEEREWPVVEGRPRRAGVSSFGISGTNAHIILEEAPEPPAVEGHSEPSGTVPLLLSAASRDGLIAHADALREHLAAHPAPAAVVGRSLAVGRAAFAHRAVVLADDERPLPGAFDGLTRSAAPLPGGLAFLFSGQGSQRLGMGRELYGVFPVFAAVFDEVCGELDGHLGGSVRGVVFGDDAVLLGRTVWAQAGLFAVEVALFRLLESWGVRPDYLLGHSIGEVAAACVAGVFSLPDAARLVAARGRLMDALPGGGVMVAVGVSPSVVGELVSGYEGRVGVAAVNGPASVVVSGDADAVARIANTAREAGHRTKQLEVSHAFHSPLMEPMLDEFAAALREVELSEPRIPVVSNVTGRVAVPGELSDAGYWVRHVRQSVLFLDGVRTLAERGVTRYVELGPDAVLTAAARECLPEPEPQSRPEPEPVTGTSRPAPGRPPALAHDLTALLRHGRSERATVAAALGALFTWDVPVDWAAYFGPVAAGTVELPRRPFRRDRYWPRPGTGRAPEEGNHPLLGAPLRPPGSDEVLFTGRLSARTHPWIADHVVNGTAILPGTGFAELALEAGGETGHPVLAELTVLAPLVLPGGSAVELHVAVAAAEEPGRRPVAVHARPAGESEWTRHAVGVLAEEADETDETTGAPETVWPPVGAEPVDTDDTYARAGDMGFGYGPVFRGLRRAWRLGDQVFGEVRIEESEAADAERFILHPALLDSALHTGFVASPGASDEVGRLPFVWQGLTVYRPGPAEARVRLDRLGPDELTLSVTDMTGEPVAELRSLTLRRPPAADLAPSDAQLLETVWEPAEEHGPDEDERFQGGVAVLGAEAAAVAEALGASHHKDLTALADSSELPDVVVRRLELAQGAGTVAEAEAAVGETVALLREWFDGRPHDSARLLLTVPEPEAGSTTHAAVRALLRTAQSEHPGAITVVECEGAPTAAALRSDARELAVRDGKVVTPREVPVRGEDATEVALGDGPVLITGGTGGLGAVLAQHLVKRHGVRTLVLLSRTAGNEEHARLVAELRELGADVTLAACDVTDREALAHVVAGLDRPLSAVVHAAGIVDDGLVTGLTEEQFARVMRVKAEGARNLHAVTEGQNLAAFVLFSSAAAVHGSPGQANYAAANGFLDAFAAHRRSLGLPALSLRWGPWAQERGMAGRLGPEAVARMARHGTVPLGTEAALALLDAALTLREGPAAPLAVRRSAPQRRASTAPRRGGRGEQRPLTERLAGVGPAARERLLADLVTGEVAAVLGHRGGDRVDGDRSFRELGLDSLGAIELRNRLGERTGLRLTPTLIFDFPTPVLLAGHLDEELAPAPDAPDRSVIRVLDQLEAQLRDAGPESATGAYAGERLRALAALLGGAAGTKAGTAGSGATDYASAMEDASDEELFDILDGEVGI
ncbi:SDR family NAD(P)-dependent oxidoreductase [Streptomyces sp. AJS327]|nr:SDR family NAD(P)-dependent oxidoreductase [Streptomyces sp. AJS327]